MRNFYQKLKLFVNYESPSFLAEKSFQETQTYLKWDYKSVHASFVWKISSHKTSDQNNPHPAITNLVHLK